MIRFFLVDHEGRPIVETPPPPPEVEQQTLDEFCKFCEAEARKASTVNKKEGQ